jgi:hypothetical protein
MTNQRRSPEWRRSPSTVERTGSCPIDADEFWVGTEITLKEVLTELSTNISAPGAEVVNFVQRREAQTTGPESLLAGPPFS